MKSSPRPRAPPAAVAVTASTAAAMDVVPPRNEAQAATSTPLETPELAQNASEMLGARPDRRAARLRSSSARWGAAGFRGPSLVGSLRRRLPRSKPRGCFAPQASAVRASWVRRLPRPEPGGCFAPQASAVRASWRAPPLANGGAANDAAVVQPPAGMMKRRCSACYAEGHRAGSRKCPRTAPPRAPLQPLAIGAANAAPLVRDEMRDRMDLD